MEIREKIGLVISFMVFIIVLLTVMITLFSFKDNYKNILEGYCDNSGGTWTFYECYHSPLSQPCEKEGNYCDYPDGTSESEDEISWRFNSTI